MPAVNEPVRRFLAPCLAAAIAAQAVAAILFFFAANWWGMAPALKIGLIDGLLLLCAVAAALSVPASFARSAWAVAGAVLSGVLFGVHGQVWQTGADAWELFALWAGLAALWAGLARSDGAWALVAGLGMVALGLWGANAAPRTLLPAHWLVSLLAAAPLVVAVAARFAGSRSSWLDPLLLAALASALGTGGVAGLDDSLAPLGLGLAVAAAGLALARPRRFGPWPFALALILSVVLLEALAIQRLTGGSGVESGLRMLLVAALLLAGLAGVAFVLRRLFPVAAAGSSARLHALLSVAIGAGAWIAAGVAAAGLGGLVDALWGHDSGLGAVALGAGIAALLLIDRAGQASPFRHHLQGAFALIAYGAVLGEAAMRMNGFGAVVLASVLLLAPLAWLTRAGMAVVLATGAALSLAAIWLYTQAPWSVAVLAVAIAIPGWFGLNAARPALRAGSVCLILAAFVLPGLLEFVEPDQRWIWRGAAVAAGGGLMAASLWSRRALADLRLAAAGGLVLAVSLAVPAGGAGLVGLTAASARAVGRPLVALGFAAAGWSVVRFYYLLAVPLAQKSALLAVGAAVTALAWALLAGRPHLRLRFSALLLAGAVVPAALQTWDAGGKAAVVAEGRQVLLPLRPADPRSLIQGDFMALRYNRELMAALPETGGPVVLRLDGDGVAVAARPAAEPAGADEVLVRSRPGRGEPRLAPDSFLFQEGTGKDWAQAKFAIVRVAGGELVLTGLADSDRRPIVPGGR